MTEPQDPKTPPLLSIVLQAAGALSARRTDTRKALSLLEPYKNLDFIEGETPRHSNILLSMVCATVADAHRMDGDYQEAARWYLRAIHFYPGGGHTAYFADMVIEQQLAAFYQDALDGLEEANKLWKQLPWELRVNAHFQALWACLKQPWNLREYLRRWHQARSYTDRLQQRIAAQATSDTSNPHCPP